MIDKNASNAMKNGSYFINTSRGDVVVEEALIINSFNVREGFYG